MPHAHTTASPCPQVLTGPGRPSYTYAGSLLDTDAIEAFLTPLIAAHAPKCIVCDKDVRERAYRCDVLDLEYFVVTHDTIIRRDYLLQLIDTMERTQVSTQQPVALQPAHTPTQALARAFSR